MTKTKVQLKHCACLPWLFALVLTAMLSLAGLPSWLRNQPIFLRLRLVSVQVAQPLSLLDAYFDYQLNSLWLKQAYFQSQAKLVRLGELEEENRALRHLLEVKTDSSRSQVVVSPIYSRSQALVAAGSADGLRSGSLVFGSGVLLGLVDQVEPHVSRVKLLTESSELRILVKTESGVMGLTRVVDGQLLLTEIPPDLVVKLREPVFTVGQPGIPGRLLVGLVGDKLAGGAEPTYAVKLDQGVSFYAEPIVSIQP